MPIERLPSAPAEPGRSHGVLAARQLACQRGRRRLFRGLDLSLAPGTLCWLRGANGCGKTSLLRILAGLSAPSEGAVTWNGQPWAAVADEARAGVVYIGHGNALKDDLSLAEALAFLARLQSLDQAEARADAALLAVGLASRRQAPVRTLSQGQRRRGALARLALDDAPRTWLLDEPYDALDAASVGWLSGLIEGHAARGGAVLLTSHQPLTLAGLRDIDLQAWCAA